MPNTEKTAIIPTEQLKKTTTIVVPLALHDQLYTLKIHPRETLADVIKRVADDYEHARD